MIFWSYVYIVFRGDDMKLFDKLKQLFFGNSKTNIINVHKGRTLFYMCLMNEDICFEKDFGKPLSNKKHEGKEFVT